MIFNFVYRHIYTCSEPDVLCIYSSCFHRALRNAKAEVELYTYCLLSTCKHTAGHNRHSSVFLLGNFAKGLRHSNRDS